MARIPRDTLTCELAPNAVKNDELSCSVPPLEYLDLWSTIGDVATALLTLALVVLAGWAGWTAVKTLNQTRQNSIDQTRPYVFAQVVPSIAGSSIYDLVIQNTGQSTARNLTIACPQFPSEPDRLAVAIGKLFDIEHVLPPQGRIRTYWHFSGDDRNWSDGEGDMGLPPVADIQVSYDGPDGHYEDTFPINIGVYAMTPVGASGHEVPTDLTKPEKNLHKMLAVIAGNISNLGR
ncbi:hypothetical protein [Arthrobacter burdickii]|uniref:DUF11 domain-containing protein n=1 Tax=Arthrobacter burdickii TaxID=3035920 RepID=A0ABT8K3A9_9MICC|nr:hypothetical protein [Arthrobacter burdickii]MDN4611935.1 hypothetical protein [Arthrobacter burdickii]